MSEQNHRCMNCGQEPWNRAAAPEITNRARQNFEHWLDSIASLHPNDYRGELDAVERAAVRAWIERLSDKACKGIRYSDNAQDPSMFRAALRAGGETNERETGPTRRREVLPSDGL